MNERLSTGQVMDRDTVQTPRYARYDVAPDPHILDFLVLVAKHKWITLFLIFFVGIGCLVLTYYMPLGYETRAVILPPDRNSSADLLSKFSAAGALKMLKAVENPSVDLLQNILESREVAHNIAADSTIARYYATYIRPKGEFLTPIEWLQSTLRIEPGFTHVLVNTSQSTGWTPSEREKDETRKVIARIANKATDEVQDFLFSSLRSGAHLSKLYAEDEYAANLHELDSLEGERQLFEEQNRAVSLPDQIKSLIASRALIATQLTTSRMKEQAASTELTSTAPEVMQSRSQEEAASLALQELEKSSTAGPGFSALPAVTRKYASIQLRIAELEPVVMYLRQEVEQEKINELRDKKIIQVIDPATVPLKKSSPKRLVMLLSGLTSGAALALAYIALRAFLEHVKRDKRTRPFATNLHRITAEAGEPAV